MKKRIIIIILALAAVGVAAWIYHERGKKPDNRIVVSGNIELTEVNIAFKTAGKLIERTVDEGDAVKKGQVIARLDRDQLVAQRQRDVAALESAESQLAQAETALEWEKATLAGDVEQKRGDVASNEARLAELQNGARPQEKLDAQAAVDSAQSELDRSKKDWDRAQQLFKDDDISAAQFDQYRNRWESAAAALKSAKERQALVLLGPRAEVIHAQQAALERSRGALKMGEANTLEMKRREQELAARRA
ncbi:MAG: biotin/lipoyl-binding protein, partial [Bryobacteraceae bacterium]